MMVQVLLLVRPLLKLKKAKAVLGRIFRCKKECVFSGTAQFDPFAKELGVIANVIVETPGKKKQERQDLAKEKKSRTSYAYTNESNGWYDISN